MNTEPENAPETVPDVTVKTVPVAPLTVTSGIDVQDMPPVMPNDMPTDEDYLAALGPCGK